MKELVIFSMFLMMMNATYAQTLAEKLGYLPTDKLLIVNADDAGMCHAANVAVMDGMNKGKITSASIMVPCPWFKEIAEYAVENPASDFGVHLTHTAEWKYYKWGPVVSSDKVPGLIDAQRYLWPGVRQVYENAAAEEALVEGRAQIQKALDAGIPVTHLDSHMGTLQLHPDYVAAYLQLAKEFNLPVRMASQQTLANRGFAELRDMFRAEGIYFPDYFIYEELENYDKDVKAFWSRILKSLKPGVTELYIHPAIPNDELKAITNSWKTRGLEYEVFVNDADIQNLMEAEDIIRIGYKPILELQRSTQ